MVVLGGYPTSQNAGVVGVGKGHSMENIHESGWAKGNRVFGKEKVSKNGLIKGTVFTVTDIEEQRARLLSLKYVKPLIFIELFSPQRFSLLIPSRRWLTRWPTLHGLLTLVSSVLEEFPIHLYLTLLSV